MTYRGVTLLWHYLQFWQFVCWPVSATLPRYAVAKIIGNINDQEFGISVLTANISRMAQGTRISADLHGVPTEIGQEFFFFEKTFS